MADHFARRDPATSISARRRLRLLHNGERLELEQLVCFGAQRIEGRLMNVTGQNSRAQSDQDIRVKYKNARRSGGLWHFLLRPAGGAAGQRDG
jgi:hypothetical protein